jgi:large subunit ribosomal protein L10Ae
MSKIQTSSVRDSIKEILRFSKEDKPRKFVETIELQVRNPGLKIQIIH